MRIVFEQKYWFLVLVISFLLSGGLTLLLYYRNKDVKDLTPWQKRILMTLRFITVFFLASLLTAPLLRTLRKITEYPRIVVAIDNSMSMKGLPGTLDLTPEITEKTEKILGSLEAKYQVIRYTFGSSTIAGKDPDFREKVSDYGQMLQSVYDNHFSENTGALVIIGDGNYNQGENPLNTVKKFHFPVYTVGTGDTTSARDAGITEVRINKSVFTGNQFPVEADVKISGLPGSRLRFSVAHQGKEIFFQRIEVHSPDFFTTVSMAFEASGTGLQYYTAALEAYPGEQNTLNNSWLFVINILENKQKILILSEGPHPDIGAIRNSLEKQVNYDVAVFTTEPFPADLKGNNLIILNQLPSSSESCRQILDQSNRYRIPLLVIIGSKTLLPQLKILGMGVEIVPMAGEFDEAQAVINDRFMAFNPEKELKDNLTGYPPLKVPFARYSLDPEYVEFAFQKVKNVATGKPLIAFGNRNGIKTGIIFGEGIWRWRIYDHLLSRDKSQFVDWIDKTIQYLAIHDNEDNFIVDFKPVYRETENIRMSAEVYNKAFEPIENAEVNIEISDSLNRVYLYSFDHIKPFYRMDAGIFPPGQYHFKSSAKTGDAEFSETGDFAVVPVNLEQLDFKANHRLLFQLSNETNGRFFNLSDASSLISEISANNAIKPSNYFQTAFNELIGQRWLIAILLLFMSAEWFLRKFWGIY